MSEMATAMGISDEEQVILHKVVLAKGNCSRLSDEEKTAYYLMRCRSLGLNPMTGPLEYTELNGKLVLYTRKDATEQLRKLHGVSIEIVSQKFDKGIWIVHTRAKDRHGRTDEDFGFAKPEKTSEDAMGNALLKAITKGKRRVTLSLCGLGDTDESELETIPGYAFGASAANREDELAPVPRYPTAEAFQSLMELSTSAGVERADFRREVLQYLELPLDTQMTRQELRERMTLEQFDNLWKGYQQKIAQRVEQSIAEEVSGDERTTHSSPDTRESPTEDEPTSPNSTEPAAAEDASASRLAPVSAEEGIYASKVTVDTVVDLAPEVGEDAVKKVQHLMAQHGGRLPQKDAEELTTEFRQRQAVKAKAAKKG